VKTIYSEKTAFKIDARTAYDCGCGLPARVEFSLCGNRIMIDDPRSIDAAIATLQEARAKLWPDVCEHGIENGQWCEACNKAAKEARKENMVDG
jgi:hypothetical protein